MIIMNRVRDKLFASLCHCTDRAEKAHKVMQKSVKTIKLFTRNDSVAFNSFCVSSTIEISWNLRFFSRLHLDASIIGLEQFHNNDHWGLRLNFFILSSRLAWSWSLKDHTKKSLSKVAAVQQAVAKKHKFNAAHSCGSTKSDFSLNELLSYLKRCGEKKLMDCGEKSYHNYF